ncbi:MAG: type II toxin-antitoxin system HicA family toxin [Chloroflexi bacterium]|nr:type II toxin-antitoxin system HicA family toxin [Chloroflexota bacterium]
MRLPRLTGREVIRALERLGFQEIRVRGSHHHLTHPSDHSRWATVPVHGSRVLHPKILQSILRTTRVTREEFTEQL